MRKSREVIVEKAILLTEDQTREGAVTFMNYCVEHEITPEEMMVVGLELGYYTSDMFEVKK